MLETAERSSGGSAVGFLEQCICPKGYIGLSCEKCDYGYARVEPDGSSLRQHAVCSKCNCHSHAATCDPSTGQCTVKQIYFIVYLMSYKLVTSISIFSSIRF